jgi:hypothetical protein
VSRKKPETTRWLNKAAVVMLVVNVLLEKLIVAQLHIIIDRRQHHISGLPAQ